MGTLLNQEYIKSEDLNEQKLVEDIIKRSNEEYDTMEIKHTIKIKAILLIAGTMILFALISRALFEMSNSNSKVEVETPKKITNTIEINK